MAGREGELPAAERELQRLLKGQDAVGHSHVGGWADLHAVAARWSNRPPLNIQRAQPCQRVVLGVRRN